MRRWRGGVVALVLAGVALVLLGALLLRERLTTTLPTEATPGPPLTFVPGGPEAATPTPTAGVVVRVLPTRSAAPVATVIPPPPPPPGSSSAVPGPSGTAPRPDADGVYRSRFPYVRNDPTLPNVSLTPEPLYTATPVAVATPVPAPPGPTVTPTPTLGPPRKTKLGVGLYDSGGAFLPVLDQMRPSVILLMDPSVDFAKEVRREFPQAFIVGRIFAIDQPLDNPQQRGVDFANRVAQTAVPLKGIVNAWMSYNEVTGHGSIESYQKYNTFATAFAHQMQDVYGIDAVAGNDGTGTVDPVDYVKYFRESIEASHYFGIHSYAPFGATTMRDPSSQYLTLRHRLIKAELDKAGIRSGPFIITEAGLWDGWRGVTSERSMATDFTWFADETAKDDYVLGITIFGLFRNDSWEKFNVAGTSIIQQIGQYNTQH